MAEVVKCPNCNAQIHIMSNCNIVKCEYCNSEIIIDNNIPIISAQTNNYVNSENHLCEGDWIRKVNYVSAENYPEEMQKWNKKYHKQLIIQAVLSAFSVLIMKAPVLTPLETDNEIVKRIKAITFIIVFFAPMLYFAYAPLFLSNKKPCLPNVQIPDIQKYTAFNCRKMFPAFLCAFFGGIMIMLMLTFILIG